MGSRDTDTGMKARPILNERDYQNAKSLLAKEMHNTHSDRVWARLEALMQAVADYERRFLEGEEEDATDWIRYAYAGRARGNRDAAAPLVRQHRRLPDRELSTAQR